MMYAGIAPQGFSIACSTGSWIGGGRAQASQHGHLLSKGYIR
ncbi:MAG TPA: hypothetical protein VIM41_08710 [Gammaproteobacteria bacterium]